MSSPEAYDNTLMNITIRSCGTWMGEGTVKLLANDRRLYKRRS